VRGGRRVREARARARALHRAARAPPRIRCSIWQVDNDAGTFLAVRGHGRRESEALLY